MSKASAPLRPAVLSLWSLHSSVTTAVGDVVGQLDQAESSLSRGPLWFLVINSSVCFVYLLSFMHNTSRLGASLSLPLPARSVSCSDHVFCCSSGRIPLWFLGHLSQSFSLPPFRGTGEWLTQKSHAAVTPILNAMACSDWGLLVTCSFRTSPQGHGTWN